MDQLSDASFIVNNKRVVTIPNTIEYDEGLGEQDVKAGSVGDGEVEPIYSNDIESNISCAKCELPTTIEMIDLAREWKKNRNRNLVQIVGKDSSGKKVTKTFRRAALVNNYPVQVGSDASIPIEFKSAPAQ